MRHHHPSRRFGFSLVELIVVVAIVGVLFGMLLPAVQKTREAAARTQCASNLRQMGIAVHAFHDACGQLPKVENNWSIHVRLLPFLEEGSQWQELNAPATTPYTTSATYRSMSLFVCPGNSRVVQTAAGLMIVNETVGNPVAQLAPAHADKCSYMASSGSDYFEGTCHDVQMTSVGAGYVLVPESSHNGAFPLVSKNYDVAGSEFQPLWYSNMTVPTVTWMDFRDGTSHTILFGEGSPTGKSWWQSETSFASAHFDFGSNLDKGFAATHGRGCNFLFGDGSVSFIASPDTDLLQSLAARADGHVVP